MTGLKIPTPSFLRYTRATADAIATQSPADDLISANHDRWVRCITIYAPQQTVYRWLCQLTVAPYSFDALDFAGRRSPRTLTPGAEQLRTGQHFLIFAITSFVPNSSIAGISRPEFVRRYGQIAVSYSVDPLGPRATLLRANACIQHSDGGVGFRRLLLAAGDKIMAGRQLRTMKALAESASEKRLHNEPD